MISHAMIASAALSRQMGMSVEWKASCSSTRVGRRARRLGLVVAGLGGDESWSAMKSRWRWAQPVYWSHADLNVRFMVGLALACFMLRR